MITHGKTGYWFRSLKVRPGGRKENEKRESEEDYTQHGIKDSQHKLKIIPAIFVFVYISWIDKRVPQSAIDPHR